MLTKMAKGNPTSCHDPWLAVCQKAIHPIGFYTPTSPDEDQHVV